MRLTQFGLEDNRYIRGYKHNSKVRASSCEKYDKTTKKKKQIRPCIDKKLSLALNLAAFKELIWLLLFGWGISTLVFILEVKGIKLNQSCFAYKDTLFEL